MKTEIDFGAYATVATKASKLIWPALVEEWVTNRVQGTKHGPLEEYIGKYTNEALKLTIDVCRTDPKDVGKGPSPRLLCFKVNSIERQSTRLRHYHYDTWSFLPDSRDDAIKQGMEAYMVFKRLQLVFLRDFQSTVYALEWDLQAGSGEGPARNLDRVSPVRFLRV